MVASGQGTTLQLAAAAPKSSKQVDEHETEGHSGHDHEAHAGEDAHAHDDDHGDGRRNDDEHVGEAGHDDHGHTGNGHEEDFERGANGGRLLKSDAGPLSLEITIYEAGQSPPFRVYAYVSDEAIDPSSVDLSIELGRLGGKTDRFKFNREGAYLAGDGDVVEPHSFDVAVKAKHAGQSYSWAYASYEGRTEIGKAAAGLGVAFGALQVVSFARDSIAAFSDLEESVNAVEVVYGTAADAIHELGLESADTFGLSTRAVNDAAVGMGAFADKINAADPADAFKNIIQRATDFGSVMNITTEETLEKFRAGLSGEAEPLKKFGLDLSEATVKQVALDEGIIATGETMTATQKVQARYLTIMKQTEKTAGDFANTSDGLAGSQKKLSAKWEEAQAALGEKLAPAMTKLIQAGVDLLPVFSKVVGAIADVVAEVEPFISVVADLVLATGDYGDATDDATDSTDSWIKAVLGWKPLGDEVVESTGEVVATVDLMEAGFARAALEADALSASLPIVTVTAEDLAEEAEDLAKEAEDLAKEFGEVADKGRDVFRSVKNVQTLMRELVDPVFAAKRATDAYNDALEESREEAGISADEFANLVDLYGDMKAAEAAVGVDNIAAVAELAGEVNREIGGAADQLPGFMESLTSFDSRAFGKAEEVIERMERLTSQRFDFDISLSAPSPSSLRRALLREIERLKREGLLVSGT